MNDQFDSIMGIFKLMLFDLNGVIQISNYIFELRVNQCRVLLRLELERRSLLDLVFVDISNSFCHESNGSHFKRRQMCVHSS